MIFFAFVNLNFGTAEFWQKNVVTNFQRNWNQFTILRIKNIILFIVYVTQRRRPFTLSLPPGPTATTVAWLTFD